MPESFTFAIPPRLLGGDQAFNAWEHASALQLLRLLKVLGVDQRSVANHLGVAFPAISMWLNNRRPTPEKYRPALRVYAEAALGRARNRRLKEAQMLPNAELKDAAMWAFESQIVHWGLEVLHSKGILQHSIQRECFMMGQYAGKETLTAEDRHAVASLCKSIQSQLKALDGLDEEHEVQEGQHDEDV